MKSQKNYVIKQANLDELKIMTEWAAGEGWNPGLSDAECFYKADPNGFFIGYLDDEPISCISAVSYGNEFSFIGFYIVKEAFRGKGYGIQIWNKAIEHLSQNQNIGLDGVVAQQENYKKSGFVLAYRNIRFEYTVPENRTENENENIYLISDDNLLIVKAIDLEIFGHNREDFLESWINQSNGKAICFIDEKDIKGYGVIRKCGIGHKIGPLFCRDGVTADALFQSLLNYTKSGEKVYLDVPEVNQGAMYLVANYDMQKSFETARMYTNLRRDYLINKVYGVTTFELG